MSGPNSSLTITIEFTNSNELYTARGNIKGYLIASLTDYFLLAIIILQITAYIGICSRKKEPLRDRIFVLVLAILTLFRSITATYDVWYLVVHLFLKPTLINDFLLKDWLHKAGQGSTSLCFLVEQIFFTIRFYQISRNQKVLGLIILFISMWLGAFAAYIILVKGGNDFSLKLVTEIFIALVFVTDLTLSLGTCFYVWKEKENSFRPGMINLLNRLMVVSLQSAIPVTVLALTTMVITALHGPVNYANAILIVISAKISVMNVLYALNLKPTLAKTLNAEPAISDPNSPTTTTVCMPVSEFSGLPEFGDVEVAEAGHTEMENGNIDSRRLQIENYERREMNGETDVAENGSPPDSEKAVTITSSFPWTSH